MTQYTIKNINDAMKLSVSNRDAFRS